jgi:hypothetical protein
MPCGKRFKPFVFNQFHPKIHIHFALVSCAVHIPHLIS